MKTPSKRDLGLIAIFLFLGSLLGWASCHIWENRKEPISVESPINESLKKTNDSLEAVIIFRDSLEKLEDKKQIISDSIINKNHNILSKHYENLKNLDLDARIHAYDSILSNYKMWR